MRRAASHIDFLPICPECEIGLGVPREPVRIVRLRGQGERLLQPATGRDFTATMEDFARRWLEQLGEVDGFLLKDRSPSCGLCDTKVYPKIEKSPVAYKTAGFFGRAVLARFSHLAIDDSARLSDYRRREHFLVKLYTMARFRAARTASNINALVNFVATHKLLLMAYNQKAAKEVGAIVANHAKRPLAEIHQAMSAGLAAALAKPARASGHANALQHVWGYISPHVTPEDRKFFLATLDRYRRGRAPLSACLHTLRAWITHFNIAYLANQVYFEPYPSDLMDVISDSGKGREY